MEYCCSWPAIWFSPPPTAIPASWSSSSSSSSASARSLKIDCWAHGEEDRKPLADRAEVLAAGLLIAVKMRSMCSKLIWSVDNDMDVKRQ